MADQGALLIMTVDDLFVSYIKDHQNIRDYQILVVSKDIQASVTRREGNQNVYESKYDNVDFVPSLIPTPQSMEYAYTDVKDRFFEAYDNHLISDEPFSDLCCIIDLVVNDNVKCIIVVSQTDMYSEFPYRLKDFILEHFEMNAYLFEEIQETPDLNIFDIGDVTHIKEILAFQKNKLSESDDPDDFFNRFTDNMVDKYRRILLKRDIDELCQFAEEEVHIHVNKRRQTKEEIVDAIIKEKYGDLIG